MRRNHGGEIDSKFYGGTSEDWSVISTDLVHRVDHYSSFPVRLEESTILHSQVFRLEESVRIGDAELRAEQRENQKIREELQEARQTVSTTCTESDADGGVGNSEGDILSLSIQKIYAIVVAR